MFLEIITPDKTIFSGETSSVLFPGADGGFEVLNQHAPIISTLVEGPLRVRTTEGDKIFNIDGGVVEVLKNKLIVLAESVKA